METIQTPLETIQTPLMTKDEMAELLDIKSPHEKYTVTASDLTGWSSSSTTWEPTTITYPATYKTYITTDDVSTIAGLASDAAKKEDLEKIDKHIDELEQDIDYFEQKRVEQETEIQYLRSRVDILNTKNKELEIKVEKLDQMTTYLFDEITKLKS